MRTLGDYVAACGIQTGPFGSQLHAHEYASEGVGVVMPQDLGENQINHDSMARITPERAESLGKHRLLPGDIVYSRRGDVTRRSLVRSSDPEMICGTGCLRVRLDTSVANPTYVSYALGTPSIREWITRHAVGATMANLNTQILSEVPLGLPDLETQQAIAEVLGALDDKIAANSRVQERCDALRNALWKRATSDAEQVPLSSVAQFVNGGAFTKGASGTGRAVVRIAEMNQGVTASTVFNSIDVKDEQVVRTGDFLMSWSGSLISVRWALDEAILNQHIFKVIPKAGYPLWAVSCAVDAQLPYFQFVASNKATTMGHIQRHHLDETIAWPEISPELDSLGQSLWDLALRCETENIALTRTRDELLPLLMSGRMKVRDAQARVEEVM